MHVVSLLTLLALLTGLSDPPSSRPADAARPSAVPASLPEAAQILDLRTFPMLEHGEVFFKTAIKVGYRLVKPELEKDVAFLRGKLVEGGWKVDSEDVNSEKAYGLLQLSKSGFSASVSVVKDPNSGGMQVFVENQGNVDARSLPKMPGAVSATSQFNVANYLVDAKPDAAADFVRGELKKLGWREVVGPGGRDAEDKEGPRYLRFIQRGVQINAHVEAKDGKSEFGYHPNLLKLAPPVMPEATSDTEFLDDPFLHLFYAVKAAPETVLGFYRKELPALGWSMEAGPDKVEGGKAKVAMQGPDKEPMRLEVMSDKGITFVMIASGPGA